jgi:protease I
MEENTVLLVIASQGFQQDEYNIPKNMLRNAGFTVITASDKPGIATAKNGTTTHVDITLDKVLVNNYAGIFFIGGPGAEECLDNNTSYKIIQDAFYQHKPIGAICIASRILANAGILDGKYATGWNEDGLLEGIFAENHAIYLPTEKVVVDSHIITATDPSVAQEFGKRIIELLQSKQSWG